MKKIIVVLGIFFSGNLFSQITQPTGTGTNTSNACSSTYVDNGGGGNYSSNQNSVQTICPTVAGQYVRVTFTSFDTQAGVDVLYVFNGLIGGGAIGSYTGTTIPAAITSSDPSGCLTFHFYSNATNQRPGWLANVTCTATPGTTPSNSAQDCNGGGGTTVCGTATLSGNSSGAGSTELSAVWDGCLNGENQSSWYYFSPSASGTVGFTISPTNGTDDYDFAIWGPSIVDNPCPFATGQSPIRCSYAAGGGNTGLSGAAADVSEGALGDKFVSLLPVTAGDIYVLLIDNYSATTSPFTLTWALSGGAALDCALLPIELLGFNASYNQSNKTVDLEWQTASETNNDYFTLERSVDGQQWNAIKEVDGAGNSNSSIVYNDVDPTPLVGTSYYRLKQTDFDGAFSYSEISVVKTNVDNEFSITAYPNPINGNSFTINFSGLSGKDNYNVSLRNLLGELVYSNSFLLNSKNPSAMVDLQTQLPSGTYILCASNGSKKSFQKLMIK